MPRVDTSYDELVSKSDLAHEFPSMSVQLTVDPVMSNISDDSQICAEKLSVTGSEEKEEERSAGRSRNHSTSSNSSYFVPKTDFVVKFDEINIKPNEMLKHFKKTFAKNCASKLNSSPLTKQAAPARSTVTKETGSQLNPNCEPYVPTISLEQVSTSLSSGQSNCDVKPFDPIEFHQKMVDLRFVPDHNMTAYLGDPPEKHSEFKSLIEGLILSPVNYAIMENPSIVADFIRGFWSTVEEHTDAHKAISIVGKVQGKPITITKQRLRECLQFGDKESDPVELDQELINRTVYQMGHEGAYPPTEKKLLHPYWRY
ncbi:hypothetical protein R6Q57_024177 [Mikania cordata]